MGFGSKLVTQKIVSTLTARPKKVYQLLLQDAFNFNIALVLILRQCVPNFALEYYVPNNKTFNILSGSTGSGLAWHTQGRMLAARLLQQVVRFVSRIYTV